MKINGEFLLREVVGETVLIPVGKTALEYNGMIIINQTGAFIWKALEEGLEETQILSRMTEIFEVAETEAAADLKEFLENLKTAGILK